MRLPMAIRSRSFFAEILYNNNSNNSNGNSKVDNIRITHNSNSNIGNINEIV